MKRHRKIALSLLITLSLQLNFVGKAVVVGKNTTVDLQQNIPIVQINTPQNNLSYNSYEHFDVNDGLIINNSINNVDTQLLGNINANSNLQHPAKIIVNEVVGTNISNLNGIIEIAGAKADVVIANPNGIIVNNLNFINADRAVITTGIPHITHDELDNFTVNKGKIIINGNVNFPLNTENDKSLEPINTLKILARAVEVNSEIFAKDKIKIITGQNKIDYAQGNVLENLSEGRINEGIALDVSTLGGMYANNIFLIGTEKGLGINLNGNIDALNGDLHIDTAGNLTIKENIHNDEPTSIQGKNININSQNYENNGNVIAEENIKVNSRDFINNETILATQIDINAKNVFGNGIFTADNNLVIKAEDKLDFNGGMSSKDGIVKLEAKDININKNSITVKDNNNLIIVGPEITPKEENEKPIEQLVDNITDTEDINDLNLTVNDTVNKNNQPIIDKTRNNIDLINIAQIDANGVSKNKYINFNVKPKGLILNNSNKHTNTRLAGYIDKNMFLSQGAKTIINEVTSSNKTFLNGFIEVAGNPADVVIINPNGILINGLGFINSKNITLHSLDIQILSKGFNGLNLNNINIHTDNFLNKNSEILSKGNINIIANKHLKNISSDIIAGGNINISAENIDNHKEKFTTDWVVTEEDRYEKIPHLNQGNYYDADRKYHRFIKTGIIKEETPESKIISHKDLNIYGNNISNKFSKLIAGDNLNLSANNLENIGYQGTIHFDDLGRDRHYWKYKKKKRFLGIGIGSKWVYGHTDLHYENHQVFDVESNMDSERIAVISSNGTTDIKADNFVNKTLEADGKEYELRNKKHSNEDYILNTPLANFTPEEKLEYTDKKQFLMSDYRYNRLKSDPENIYRRLSNAYNDQEKLKLENIRLINEAKLREYGSSIISGRNIKIYNDTLMNKGIIHAYDTLLWHGKNLGNLGIIEAQEVQIKADILRNLSAKIKALNNLNIDTSYLLNETVSIRFKNNNYLKDFIQTKSNILSYKNMEIKANRIDNIAGKIEADKVSIDSKDLNLITLDQKYNNASDGVKLENISYIGSIIQGNNINLNADKINTKGSDISGNEIKIKAYDFNLENVKNYNYANIEVGRKASKYFNKKIVSNERLIV